MIAVTQPPEGIELWGELRARGIEAFRADVAGLAPDLADRVPAALLLQLADVVRVRYILPRREDFEPCWLLGTRGRPPPTCWP